jgi:DNA-binding response OmpR family regulator
MDSFNSNELILCVEDHDAITDLIRNHLAEFEVKFAKSYESAIGLLDSYRFALALVDYCLEGDRTGFDLCRYVRDHKINLHIVMMTANDTLTLDDVLQAGGHALIYKDGEFLDNLNHKILAHFSCQQQEKKEEN